MLYLLVHGIIRLLCKHSSSFIKLNSWKTFDLHMEVVSTSIEVTSFLNVSLKTLCNFLYFAQQWTSNNLRTVTTAYKSCLFKAGEPLHFKLTPWGRQRPHWSVFFPVRYVYFRLNEPFYFNRTLFAVRKLWRKYLQSKYNRINDRWGCANEVNES